MRQGTRRCWIVGVAVALAAVAVVGSLAAGRAWRALVSPYAGFGDAPIDVVLAPGFSAREMLEELERRGVIADAGWVRAWLRVTGSDGVLHAGEYRFARQATGLEVVGRLLAGDVLLHPVTVPEGLVREEIAEAWVEGGFGPREALLAAFSDPRPAQAFDARAQDLEGYLFPDTYHVPRGTDATRIASLMVERFEAAALPRIADAARARGLTLREAVTLASLIEEETGVHAERARVSQVFHNRLQRGMKLQCDPTVRYALHRAGRTIDVLQRADLTFASPWNTYHVRGLPRGPIASPGLASLIAAVEPLAGKELYFVAAPGGGHRFSRDLAAHQRAVAEWRRYARSSR